MTSRLTPIARGLSSAFTTSARAMIRAYQLTISPMLGDRCRFFPSCSAYAMQALQDHGPLRGGWLSVRRLCKCHPWHPGGIDEVPAASRRVELAKPLQ